MVDIFDLFELIIDGLPMGEHSKEGYTTIYKEVTEDEYQNSAFTKKLEETYFLDWSIPMSSANLKMKGYEIIYVYDEKKKIRYSMLMNNLVLTGKIKSEE